MNPLLSSCAAALLALAPLSCAFAADARGEVEGVIDTFKRAIIAKDVATLKGLFLKDHTSWVLVSSDAEFAQRKAKSAKATKIEPGTYLEFAEQMGEGKERFEEKFANVEIRTDGAIASVHFDYEFHEDDRVTGKGQEAWQLVKTEQGWKINAVVYSSYPLK